MPPDLRLVGEIHAVFLGELAQVGAGADRNDVVKFEADPNRSCAEPAGPGQSPMRMTALNAQCAATLVASAPVASRSAAMTHPPAKRTASAPANAGMTSTTGSVVSATVATATVACHNANVAAEPATASRTPPR